MNGRNTAAPIRALFVQLEARFGRLSDLTENPSVKVTTAIELRREDLKSLLKHETLAVHVKGFYPEEASKLVAARMEKDIDIQRNWEVGDGATDVVSVGMPFNVAKTKGPAAVDEYFSSALNGIRRMRAPLTETSTAPLLSPLDMLRLQLDEIWPSGATVRKDTSRGGLPYLPGLGRIMKGPTSHVEGFIHVDSLERMNPRAGLFSANVYLQLPPVGGELTIWPLAVKSRWDFYRHAATLSALVGQGREGQKILRTVLPKPVKIYPRAGDLVLICAQRPHAAEGFPVGTRVSMQAFITHKEGQPLQLDA